MICEAIMWNLHIGLRFRQPTRRHQEIASALQVLKMEAMSIL